MVQTSQVKRNITGVTVTSNPSPALLISCKDAPGTESSVLPGST